MRVGCLVIPSWRARINNSRDGRLTWLARAPDLVVDSRLHPSGVQSCPTL